MRSIEVLVGTDRGEVGACRLIALDGDGVRIGVPAATAFRMQPGSNAVVSLADPLTRSGLSLPAMVGWPEPQGAEDVFDLFFEVDPVDPAAERRGSVRVAPGHGTPIEVFVDPDEPFADPVPAELVDLGEGGLCVDRPASSDLVRSRVQVLLPGAIWPLALSVRLCHHRPIGAGRVRCGYQIDWDRTIAPNTQARALSAWVGECRSRVAHQLWGA